MSFPLSDVEQRLVDLRSVARRLRVSSSIHSDLIPERFKLPTALDRWLRRERNETLIEYATRCLEMRHPDPGGGGTVGGGTIGGGGGTVVGGIGMVGGGGTVVGVGDTLAGGRADRSIGGGGLGGSVLDTSVLRDIGLRGRIIDVRNVLTRVQQPQLTATGRRHRTPAATTSA